MSKLDVPNLNEKRLVLKKLKIGNWYQLNTLELEDTTNMLGSKTKLIKNRRTYKVVCDSIEKWYDGQLRVVLKAVLDLQEINKPEKLYKLKTTNFLVREEDLKRGYLIIRYIS